MNIKKIILVSAAVLVLAGLGFWIFDRQTAKAPETQVAPASQTPGTQSAAPAAAPAKLPAKTLPKTATIDYTLKGFSPSVITVAAGTKVIFKNDSGEDFWPASNNHPTHNLYPGSGSAVCSTAPVGTNFDACTPVPNNTSWSFVFKYTGAWGYHNHMNPAHTGTIIVK